MRSTTMKKVISVFAVAVAAMLVAARLVGISAAFAQSSEASSQASSQVPQAASDLRYGAFGHYGLVSHSVGFKEFAPSCCPSLFPNVQNRGFTVGALAEFPIVSGFGIGVRAAYSPLSTNFSVVNSSIPTRLGGTGSGVPRFITISYNIETALGGLDLEPLLHYRIGGLTLYAGARASYFLQANYRQFERLEDETLLYKAENSSIRAESSGRIASIRPLALWVEGGVSYEFALNAARTIFIAPEVFYVHPLGSILQDQPWSFSTIRGGISLRFAPAPPSTPSLETASEATPKPTSTPAPRSSKPPKEVALPKGVLGAKILSVAAVNPPPAGSTVASVTPNAFVDIEEFETTRSRYIAPVVFFGEKSSDIPERYNRLKASDRAAFQLDTLVSKRSAAAPTNMPTNTPASGSANARSAAQRVPDQLAAYYHVLNFVGKRLGLYPQAKITLVGLSDDVREQSSPELARKRADRIKSYLKDVWKVDDKRIAVAVGAASGLALGLAARAAKPQPPHPNKQKRCGVWRFSATRQRCSPSCA
jgi:hypothetical protein